MKYYAGIGSRVTPLLICGEMTNIAIKLQSIGYTLRSGEAAGADMAFAKKVTDKQIFLPWDGFNGHKMIYPIPSVAFDIAEQYHPA